MKKKNGPQVEDIKSVHPAANDWPMLDEERLRRLAASITENGFHPFHPIIIDHKGRILDGRNRLAACQIAGVAPTIEVYTPEVDTSLGVQEREERIEHLLIDYIRLTNERRDLTLPQKAAATALNLERQGLRVNGRWKRGSVPEAPGGEGEDTGGSSGKETWTRYMSMAGLVLDWARELLPRVAAGELALDAALNDATKRCKEEEANEKARQKKADDFAALPADLQALVETQVITLDIATRRAGLPPIYSERVKTGSLSLKEAEYLANRDKEGEERNEKERKEAIQRYVQFVDAFLNSVSCVVGLSTGDANRNDVLAALSDRDRQVFLEVERLMRLPSLNHEQLHNTFLKD